MNRFLKFITTLLIILVVLVAGAAVILPRVIDPNNYRDEIAGLVYDASGLELNINGPIGWSVFPWVGLSLEDVTVKGRENSQLAKLTNAEVSVKLLPLLGKKVEVQTATLNGLELTLIKNKQGKGNWEVSKPEKTEAAETEVTDVSSESPASSPPLELDIASIDVSGLLFSYEDQQTGQKYLIDEAGLTTGTIHNQEPVNFNLKARINMPDLILVSTISGTLSFNLEQGVFDLSDLVIKAHPDVDKAEILSITGNLHLEQQPLLAKGVLDVVRFNPEQLFQQLKIELPAMSDPNAFTQLSFKSSFTTDGKRFDADTLKLTLDDFNIDGYFKMTDIEKQQMKFSFTGNDLNLDKYLPAVSSAPVKTADSGAADKQPASATKEQPLIPEELIRSLNLDGDMKLNSLTVANLRFDKPSVVTRAANGEADVSIASDFYQGKIKLDSSVNVRQKNNPALGAVANISGISLEALATAIPELKPVHGTVDANLDVNTKGQLQSVLTKNLNGTVKFKINNGEFINANFDKMVCEGVAFIRKADLEKTDWGNSTKFRDLSGSFIINNGVASNNNLIAALTNLNLKGDGKINLVQQTLDYHLGLNIRGTESPDSSSACEVNEKYRDIAWPVRCQGNLEALQCGIDNERLGDTVADILKTEAREQIQEQLEENLKEPVHELFKGLFK